MKLWSGHVMQFSLWLCKKKGEKTERAKKRKRAAAAQHDLARHNLARPYGGMGGVTHPFVLMCLYVSERNE
jgi:hypothetical protein